MELILGKALRNAAESSVSISRVTQIHGVLLTVYPAIAVAVCRVLMSGGQFYLYLALEY